MHRFFVKAETEKDGFHLMRIEPAVFIDFENGTGFFVNRLVREGDMLLQVSKRIIFGNVDVSTVDIFLAEDHLEKGGLSATVASDDADAFTGGDEKARVAEKILGSKRLGNVLYLDHACKFRKWNGLDVWRIFVANAIGQLV